MYIDLENLLLDDVAVRGTDLTSSSIDLGAIVSNLKKGSGKPLKIRVQITTSCDAGGTSVVPKLITDTTADLATPTTVVTGPTWTDPAAGTYHDFLVPNEVTERYLGVLIDITGTYSAGNVSAWVVGDEQSNDSDNVAVTGF